MAKKAKKMVVESDLVNDTHKARLSVQNQEPSQLDGASYDDLGGPKVGGDEPNTTRIDAAKGIGTDTTIPRSVGPEPSHLKTEDDDELDVDFGDEDIAEVDDLDAQLDSLEEVDDVELDIDSDDDDELKEADKCEKCGCDPCECDSVKEDENPFAKDDEDDEKKVDESEEDDEDKPELTEDEKCEKCGCDPCECKSTSEDEDCEDDEKKIEESLKIRIKLPKAQLFESVSPKQRKQVSTILEAAIKETTKQASQQLRAHYKKLHEAKIAKRDAVLAKQMDSYLSYVVEEWVKANQVAIRQSLRVQLAEEFLNGLQKLFKEHYIDVPESKVDVVATLTKQVDKLKSLVNEQHAQKLKLRKLAEAANKARIVAEFSRTLSEAQAAKLQKLAESTAYSNAKDFRAKLTMLKESYFGDDAKPKKTQVLPEETVVIPETRKANDKKVDDPVVAATLDALKRTSQSNW